MNITIVTPGRSGSSLLQRTLTVYNNKNIKDKPTVNLADLGEGKITKDYSKIYNRELLHNHIIDNYTDQSFPDMVDLLESVDHYTISRLAYHHISENRNDPKEDIDKLYKWINNTHIVSVFRNNLFESAMSNGIKEIVWLGNIDSHIVKLQTYTNLLNDPIEIPIEKFIKYLDRHHNSISWVNDNFDVKDKFVYEDHAVNISDFIENMSCYAGEIESWESMFGLDWKSWNKVHRLMSDVLLHNDQKLLTNKLEKLDDKVSLVPIKDSLKNLPIIEQKFLQKNAVKYFKSNKVMDELIKNNLSTQAIPIKLQTLVEKKLIVKNFNECLITYNEWASDKGYEILENNQRIIDEAENEMKNWYEDVPSLIKNNITKLLN